MAIENADLISGLALTVSLLALFLSWRSFRFSKKMALQKRPYLPETTVLSHETLSLQGPESGHWKITSIRLLWPIGCGFARNDFELDSGGSIARSWLTSVGKALPDVELPLIVTGSKSDSFALVCASSKTRPKMSQRWLIRIKKND
ncbi:hypothetical protein [uncultured Parasphingorhabdus sp.]|uniref:hypothetical protein n=1 Tax=uncultured Parasphingorhabdus sp. TaxID=2709694 RepID=UPI002AA94089|nr:hypothetical protein [uncultured Parasphingorhabdus sp.]